MEPTPLSTAIQDARDTARDQLAAVWQLQVERIQEELAGGWKQQIEKVFEDRFSELGAQLEGAYRRTLAEQVEAGIEARSKEARRQQVETLNQALRRMHNAQEPAGFWRALAGACEPHAARVAVFSVHGQRFRCEAARGFENADRMPGREFAIALAAAIDSAITTSEVTIAVRSAGELSEPLIEALGESGSEKVYIFPIGNRRAAGGVIYVEQPVEVSAIELISNAALAPATAAAGASAASGGADLIRITTSDAPVIPANPDWAALSAADRELHMRAQRLARVQVAEIRLYKAQAVKKGRMERRLFDVLHSEIELARANFRRQYMTSTPTMVDYLHQELVRTLANDDPALMGPTYPGPLA